MKNLLYFSVAFLFIASKTALATRESFREKTKRKLDNISVNCVAHCKDGIQKEYQHTGLWCHCRNEEAPDDCVNSYNKNRSIRNIHEVDIGDW